MHGMSSLLRMVRKHLLQKHLLNVAARPCHPADECCAMHHAEAETEIMLAKPGPRATTAERHGEERRQLLCALCIAESLITNQSAHQ